MKIVKADFEVMTPIDGAEILKSIEEAGRVCYKSEDKITDGSAEKFVANIIKRGHEAVLEHRSITVKFTVDRGVSHEIVRHRLASYCVTGDMNLRSFSSQKSWNVETLYNWQFDKKRKGRIQLIEVRSMNETTRTIVPNTISHIYLMGKKPVVKLTTESGRSIKVTQDHKIATEDGWVEAGTLKIGDTVFANGRELYLWHKHGAIGIFSDKIVSIEDCGAMDVYDIALEEEPHNFVVNGIIVHNCQESTRYCNYSKGKFGGEITVIEPNFWERGSPEYEAWKNACARAEQSYLKLLELGATPQEARSVLPNSLKTEVVMTANLREWRSVFRLRCSPAAHPQIREVMVPLLVGLRQLIPAVFDDIETEGGAEHE